MTACTNHGGKARRVVTAALVGVLSVGTVPMVALAEGVSDAVSPMFVADDTEFSNGTATLGFTRIDADGSVERDYKDTVSPDENGVDVVTMTEAGEAYVPTVTEVIPAGSKTPEKVTSATVSNYRIRLYKAGEDGKPTGAPLSGNKAASAGEYVVTVTALSGSDFEGQVFTKSFKLVGKALPKNIVAFENDDPTDTGFRFTGSELVVDFKDGSNNELVEGRDYTVEYVRGGKTVDSVTSAGDYTAKLTGQGLYAGSTASTVIKVQAFDLSAATIVVNDFTGDTPTNPDYVYSTWTDPSTHKEYTTVLDPSLVQLSISGATSGTTVSEASTTPIQFTAKAAEGVSGSDVTGTKASGVEACKVNSLCTYTYNGSALQDSYELDASKGESFNTGAIKAFFGTTDVTSQMNPISVQKTKGTVEGTAATDLAAGKFGEYVVTIDVPAKQDATTQKVYSGSKTVTVRIWKGILDADASIYVYGPGSAKAITSYEKAYDGEVLDKDSFTVGTKDAAVARDLKRAVVDAEGNPVDSATDAGSYKLVVTSDWYKLSGTTELPITIGKVDLTTLAINKLLKWNDVAGQEYLPLDSDPDTPGTQSYVCNAVDAVVEGLGLAYDTGNGSEEEFVEDNYKGLDLLPYVVDVIVEINDGGTWKEVGEIEDAGDYRVTVTVAEEIASNFVLPEGATSVTREFTVADKSLLFSDVQPSDWYYDAVSKALKNQYMRGYAGTTTFGPEDKLTRAQAVIVLFNMSGMSFKADTDSSYDETKGWVTGFDDVDGHAYYAQAVAWANKTGVVNGYDEDTFGPEDEITREQFAAMLSNYAKVVNRDETVGSVDTSVLDEYKDANTVSGWATDAVAWAVENGVMGNNGSVMGQNKITRGEVAAMVTNYQPNPKVVIF